MSRVVVVGHAPLPHENLSKSYGPGTRTWQFAKPLVADGHEVTVVASRIPFVYPDHTEPVTRDEEHGCTVYRVDQVQFETGGITHEVLEEVDPDCVVGATAYPSYVAAIYSGVRPLWADIFGSILAEAQAKAAVYRDNAFIDHFFRINQAVIELADRFSAVSERQKYELIGQIGLVGRLNAETFGYDFACSIPCGVQPIEFRTGVDPTDGKASPGDFIVLWSGGFNTWTDTDTLFKGMEMAMSRSPRVRFVSTGGNIEGHDDMTYPRFEAAVERSSFRDRFHLKGWIKKSEAMSYYGSASVGINIDSEHYEVTFGSRNRILEWALAGLPAVSTDLCELTGELAAEGLLFTIPVGDPGALAERVLDLEAHRERLVGIGGQLERFVLERYSFEKTTLPLREWVRNPVHAPDLEKRRKQRLDAREAACRAFLPRITPDSPSWAKIKFYLRNEGLMSTLKRSGVYLGRRRTD